MTNEISWYSSISLLSVCQSACIRSYWRSAEQRSCTVMLMSMALCVWTAASGSARWWACTSLLHTVFLDKKRARAWVKECTRVCPHSQLTAGRRWSFATQQTFYFFCVFCFDVLRANCWNVLFVNARGGHSPLHLFISFLIRTASFYIYKAPMTVRKWK